MQILPVVWNELSENHAKRHSRTGACALRHTIPEAALKCHRNHKSLNFVLSQQLKQTLFFAPSMVALQTKLGATLRMITPLIWARCLRLSTKADCVA